VIGGGIVGVSAAGFLAAAGATVELFERGELAGAASGRNSGSVQHPFDDPLVALHEETLAIYRELEGFALAAAPAGVLMLARERAPLAPLAAALARDCPELAPALLDDAELRCLEPSLAPGLAACRLETGYPVPPAGATLALAEVARARGAALHEGLGAAPWVERERARGVLASGERRPAGAVLVAAGPWTPGLVDPSGGWRPIEPVWGVVAEVELAPGPRCVLEEAGVEVVAAGEPGSLFSLIPASGPCGLGSTFSGDEPEPALVARGLRDAGAAFVPALAEAEIVSTRACARPQSADGRPLIGAVPGLEGLHLAAGHGPWGISTGPAAGRLAADMIVAGIPPPPVFDAARFGAPRGE
jgi:glycine/D-amino acid oxidase-like deaminating enzyme